VVEIQHLRESTDRFTGEEVRGYDPNEERKSERCQDGSGWTGRRWFLTGWVNMAPRKSISERMLATDVIARNVS
jgi:hypothetical protein